jgi:amidohydrolase
MNRSRRRRALRASWLALTWLGSLAPQTAFADPRDALRETIAAEAKALEPKLIARRRDLHAHPELGNREERTASIVAQHLRELGLEVRSGVARTGVVGVLRGGKPGRAVGLRADMDGLPVKELTPVPFASKDKGLYLGKEVELMHACGHDAHTAILMTVAEILSRMRDSLPGSVAFYFQPAEEGPSDFVPDGKNSWGAKLMIQEGALKSPRPEAVFALHVWAGLPAGRIAYRSGATMASSDDLHIRITGKQTHAGRPWAGVDAIVVSAQAIMGLQTVVSRQTDISAAPTMVSIGTIQGGTRYNIIPDLVELEGTIRTYDDAIRKATQQKVKRTVENIAASAEAKAEVKVIEKYDPTLNDPLLTEQSLPALRWAARDDLAIMPLPGGAEDFSFMAKEVPGFFFFLGVTPKREDMAKAAPNHNPNFSIEESALVVGVRALAALALDALTAEPRARGR